MKTLPKNAKKYTILNSVIGDTSSCQRFKTEIIRKRKFVCVAPVFSLRLFVSSHKNDFDFRADWNGVEFGLVGDYAARRQQREAVELVDAKLGDRRHQLRSRELCQRLEAIRRRQHDRHELVLAARAHQVHVAGGGVLLDELLAIVWRLKVGTIQIIDLDAHATVRVHVCQIDQRFEVLRPT